MPIKFPNNDTQVCAFLTQPTLELRPKASILPSSVNLGKALAALGCSS